MKDWFNNIAPKVLAGIVITAIFLASIGVVVWLAKWILSMFGVM